MGNASAVMQEITNVAREPIVGVIKNDSPYVECISDPRSPSEQFTRTPMEIKNLIIRCANTRSSISEPVESLGAVERGSYNVSAASIINKGEQIRVISDDPRSPTPGIVRTPIQVFSPDSRYTESDESLSITSASSESYETGEDLFSMRGSSSSSQGKDQDSTPTGVFNSPKIIEKQPKTICDDVFIDEDIPAATTLTCPSNKKQSMSENEIRVKLFHTPPTKASGLKVRMPLRAFSANENLPQQILRAKQARDILESMDVENTPPGGIPDTWKRSVRSCLK